MTAPACSESEFVALVNRLQSPSAVASHLKVNVRNVAQRMKRLEGVGHTFLISDKRSPRADNNQHPARVSKEIKNGVVLVGGDAHYMPGETTIAQTAFLKLIRELKPCCVVCNGDAFDGGTISRFPRIGWQDRPPVVVELEACREHLGNIEDAAGRAALVWPLGNHDARFNTRLAAAAMEYEGVQGFRLKDHFPAWTPCWSFGINQDVIVKHRFKGGIYATRNNTLNAGRTVITGHLHSLKVTPLTDLNGTRYGVDNGTLADPYGSQFVDYLEANSVDWRSGFVVLTFHNGTLLPPETCEVTKLGAIFRGQIVVPA